MKKFILFWFFFVLWSAASADTGCLIGSDLSKGTESFSLGGASITGASSVKTSACAPGDQTSMYAGNIQRVEVFGFDVRCRVNPSPFSPYNGYYVSYSLLRCPIDDYLGFLILPVLMVSYCYLRIMG